MVKELQFDFDIDLGLEEGENSDVVSQRLDQTFSIPFALRIHPSSKRSQRIQYHRLRDDGSPFPSASFPTESHPSPRLVDVPIL
jgi:hypothetical protein